jgi:hypothetical protein
MQAINGRGKIFIEGQALREIEGLRRLLGLFRT